MADHLYDEVFRIYYSGRDIRNRSSVGSIDLDVSTLEVINRTYKPIFENGPAGSFYEAGVSLGGIYSAMGKKYLTFMAWQTPKDEHWRGDIGRLRIDDCALSIDPQEPLLRSDNEDPISLSYPCILQRSELHYNMWYGSTVTWDSGAGEMVHIIKKANSKDGDIWEKEGIAIPFKLGIAQAFSRPTILVDANNKLHMWFSYRSGTGQTYRIGYATSGNGDNWDLLLDKSGIDVSNEGWDSEMIEYPFIFSHGENYYMLYNGNGFGASGIGLAILENFKFSALNPDTLNNTFVH